MHNAPKDIFASAWRLCVYGVIVYVPIAFIGPFFNAPPPQMMVVIPFNSTSLPLSLLPVCLWLCHCLYPRAWWLADIVFCGIIASFFPNHLKPHFHTLTSVVHIVP